MTDITQIPISKLVAWDGNVRKTAGADTALAELAASIAAHGLINNLVVNPEKKGAYAVVTGGRRLAALQLLVKQGKKKADDTVACQILPAEANATEISLAENFVREEMHPADEFDAFKMLADQNMPAADIAARFGVTEKVVLERLKLARVSPVIIKAYRDGKTTLDCVMAFAVTDDHKRQERFWKSCPEWARTNRRQIRDSLTEGEIDATDRMVRFVTLQAYEKAGGTVRRDLFTDGDQGVFITKPDLLNELAAAKLQTKIDAALKDGWKWADVLAPNDHETTYKLKSIQPAGKKDTFKPEQKANAGIFVRILPGGELDVLEGYVKPGDAKAAKSADPRAKDKAKAKPAEQAGLSQSLTDDLIGQRTAAIAAELTGQPLLALRAVVHSLGMKAVYGTFNSDDRPVDVNFKHTDHPIGFAERCKPKAVVELEEQRKAWKKKLPAESKFWQWCLDADQKQLLSLLAFCAAQSCTNGELLIEPLGLDMAKWFMPTVDNYFGRIGKPQIVADLKEIGKGNLLSPEKTGKADAASFAERTAKGSGWLPKLLRTAKPGKKPQKKAA